MSSISERLARVRPPRVHITYPVESSGAVIDKELPFVVGVLSDLSGNGARPHEPLQDRQFVRIDRDNFNYVMSRIDPSLSVTIENTLTRDGSKLPVQLSFKSMEDFEPGRIVQQVQVLSKLLETRDKLVDLLSKIER